MDSTKYVSPPCKTQGDPGDILAPWLIRVGAWHAMTDRSIGRA